jgi:hypothetical protein
MLHLDSCKADRDDGSTDCTQDREVATMRTCGLEDGRQMVFPHRDGID